MSSTLTKILLITSHILVGLFTIWGAMFERALIARPEMPESAFWYQDVLIGVSCVILFVLPLLLFLNPNWYRILGLMCYLLLSFFWISMMHYIVRSMLLFFRSGHFETFFEMTHIFYILCITFYIYPIIMFIKSFIHQKKNKKQ